MAYEFRLPDLGEGVTEGEITAWLVTVGQQVAEDDPMVELNSDKATVEIASPVDGVVQTLHAREGQTVQVGDVLITIETDGDGGGDGAAAAAADAGMPSAETVAAGADAGGAGASTGADAGAGGAAPVRAAPAVRRLAAELGVDLSSLQGNGPDGAVTERDVRAAAGGGATAEAGEDTATGGERREPLRGTRRRIADRLMQSHREVPKVTVVEECDFTGLAASRGSMSFTPFVVRAVVSGLRAFPEFNASLDGDEVVFHTHYNIGVAAQGEKGLVVPVIHDADQRSLEELDAEVKRLAEAVRGDTIGGRDLHGSTFTVTLAGKLGGYFATPLVNLGEAAILGVHRIAQRPVVRDGQIVVREMGLVSCSFDHRITDGTRASMFLLHVIGELQQPASG